MSGLKHGISECVPLECVVQLTGASRELTVCKLVQTLRADVLSSNHVLNTVIFTDDSHRQPGVLF